MSLTEPFALVIGPLGAAVLSGGISIYLRRRKTRPAEVAPSPKQVQAALQKRVKDLDERLAAQYESRITYLEAQCENKDRTIATLMGRGTHD